MRVLDLLGRRWALRISWELRSGPLSFNDLQRACDAVSPSVLSQRLREMLDLGTIERDDAGRYRLTASGRSLMQILRRLDAWAQRLPRPRRPRP
jgi:DNA-binding HxlR family transcriptional regulator